MRNRYQRTEIERTRAIKILLVYLAVTTLVILVAVFFWAASISDQNWKSFVQGVTVNMASTIFAFIVIYISIKSQKISLGDPTISPDELSAQEKRIEVKLEGIKTDIVEEVKKTAQTIDTEIDIEKMDLFKFYGLKDIQPGPIFQDFRVRREGDNINAVSYLWADTFYKNTINAYILEEKEGGDFFLRVEFNNNPNSWGCNLGIRPENEKAVSIKDTDLHYLCFKAKIPKDFKQKALQNNQGNLLSEVGLAVRVVDGYLHHWEYANHPAQYIQKSVKETHWERITIPLFGQHWHLFKSDGNYLYGNINTPDFSLISCIVLKFGSHLNIQGELGPGEGTIDIKDMIFVPTP